ncbi:replication-relaxation family protein [Clostridium sp. WILCCON 0269]|uniref:Replication-relaxation family protein n=1 Tax=Candidatus Clostridium eludens TaxID=3381663 RepID=A0ABW8SSH7_9CLOT
MLSKKDKEILRFIETHKSITINQCAKCIFTGNKYAKDQARRQLRQLYKEKFIQRYQGSRSSQVVYYTIERLGIHDLKLIDVYSEFMSLGATIESSQKEYIVYTDTAKKSYRKIDAVFEINYNDYLIPIICEIDYSHYTSMKKLQDIYKSNHFQEIYGENVFPLIIIVRPVITKYKLLVDNGLLILYVDWELSNLKQALE